MTIRGNKLDKQLIREAMKNIPQWAWGIGFIGVIVFGCLFGGFYLLSDKVSVINPTLNNSVEVQQQVVDSFREYRTNQEQQMKLLQTDVSNLMYLIEELNKTTTKKLDIILKSDNTNNKQVMLMLDLLDDNFSKIIEVHARQQKEISFYQMRDTVEANKQFKIGIK